MSQIVDRRYDFVFFFDVQDGNPNGDPDAGNMPRVDPQTLQGFVTDVCIKRKIRNAVAAIAGPRLGHDLFFQTQDAVYEKRILNVLMEQAFDGAEIDKKAFKESKGTEKASQAEKAKKWLLEHYYDLRAFGAVLSTGDFNCGQVRGPVQITFSRSVDPIFSIEAAITRKSVTTVAEAHGQTEKQGSITGTFGRKSIIPYALYRGHGFINPMLAADTGFTYADLTLFFQSVQTMFELDRSAARGLMALRRLDVFQHSSALGDAPAHVLFDMVKCPQHGADAAPRSFAEYSIGIEGPLPTGVIHREISAANPSSLTLPWN